MDAIEIARVCHEVNRAYCQALGDDSQLPWSECPDWQRQSAIAGVNMHLANPGATPEDSHVAWLNQKEADGWRRMAGGMDRSRMRRRGSILVSFPIRSCLLSSGRRILFSVVLCMRLLKSRLYGWSCV